MEALFSVTQATSQDPWWWRDVTWSFVSVVLVLIAAFGAWWLKSRKRSKVASILDRIDKAHVSLDRSAHSSEKELVKFKDIIALEFKSGNIDESSYLVLDKRIDDYVRQAREKIIEERFTSLPPSLKNELKLMIDDGKVTEGEVITFEHVLSKSSVSERDKGELRSLVTEWKARKGDIPLQTVNETGRNEPRVLSHIKKAFSLGPVVVGRRKKS